MGNSCNYIHNQNILRIIIEIFWLLWIIVITPHYGYSVDLLCILVLEEKCLEN